MTESDEMRRYIALRAICAELRPAGSATNNRIIGAANVAALCMAREATEAEMMANVAARVPGLSEEESAIAVKAATPFMATDFPAFPELPFPPEGGGSIPKTARPGDRHPSKNLHAAKLATVFGSAK